MEAVGEDEELETAALGSGMRDAVHIAPQQVAPAPKDTSHKMTAPRRRLNKRGPRRGAAASAAARGDDGTLPAPRPDRDVPRARRCRREAKSAFATLCGVGAAGVVLLRAGVVLLRDREAGTNEHDVRSAASAKPAPTSTMFDRPRAQSRDRRFSLGRRCTESRRSTSRPRRRAGSPQGGNQVRGAFEMCEIRRGRGSRGWRRRRGRVAAPPRGTARARGAPRGYSADGLTSRAITSGSSLRTDRRGRVSAQEGHFEKRKRRHDVHQKRRTAPRGRRAALRPAAPAARVPRETPDARRRVVPKRHDAQCGAA